MTLLVSLILTVSPQLLILRQTKTSLVNDITWELDSHWMRQIIAGLNLKFSDEFIDKHKVIGRFT